MATNSNAGPKSPPPPNQPQPSSAPKPILFTPPPTRPPYESPINGLYPLHFENPRSIKAYLGPKTAVVKRASQLNQAFTALAEERGFYDRFSLSTAEIREPPKDESKRTPIFFSLWVEDEEDQIPRWTETYVLLKEMVEEYFPDPTEFPELQLRPPIIRCRTPRRAYPLIVYD